MSAPRIPGVFIEEIVSGSNTITAISTSTTVFIGSATTGPLNQPTKITGFREYENSFGPLAPYSEMSYSVMQFFVNGGHEAWVVRLPSPANVSADLQIAADDLAVLDSVQEPLNLLCLPGITDPASLAAAAAYCDTRNMFFIADVPKSATPSDLGTAISNSTLPRTKSGAAYYPWVNIADPLNGNQPRLCAPSGTIAGIYARIDDQRGVWRAPAGGDALLKQVQSLAHVTTEAEASALNSLGVNTLRNLPGTGIAIWGARTLDGSDQANSEYKYIPVRRMAIFLERSISEGTKWVIFEPNDAPLWARLRDVVGSFLYGFFRAGAFLGNTPDKAYFVKCDRDTMTQNDVDQGIVNVLVGFASIKPAEFVMIRISQKTQV